MNTRSLYPVLILAAILLSACRQERTELRFATAAQTTVPYAVGSTLTRVWNKHDGLMVTMLSGNDYSMTKNVDLLAANKADIALAQNDIGVTEMISDSSKSSALRTVLPIYPEIFFIIYKDSLKPTSLADLIKGRRIALGERASGTADFAQILFDRFDIDSSSYTAFYTPLDQRRLSDSIDVCCFLTGPDNPVIARILEQKDARLFSLDDIDLANRGSLADGFCLNYDGAHPYIVPKGAFGSDPEQPVLTIAVDAVLLARADVDRVAIYNLVSAIFENHHALATRSRALENLSETFDRDDLHFPLHEGTAMYLNREEPSLFEKYADLAGVLFSLAAGVVGAISAVVQWNKKRRKDQINTYYMDVVTIDTSIPSYTSIGQCDEAVRRLNDLKARAFRHLAQDKLDPDESFHILIKFIDNTLEVAGHRRAEVEGMMMGVLRPE